MELDINSSTKDRIIFLKRFPANLSQKAPPLIEILVAAIRVRRIPAIENCLASPKKLKMI